MMRCFFMLIFAGFLAFTLSACTMFDWMLDSNLPPPDAPVDGIRTDVPAASGVTPEKAKEKMAADLIMRFTFLSPQRRPVVSLEPYQGSLNSQNDLESRAVLYRICRKLEAERQLVYSDVSNAEFFLGSTESQEGLWCVTIRSAATGKQLWTGKIQIERAE